ncbi:Protein atp11, mitochondrial [Ceratocystis fimbriata CBS 114723]|uniref:Protein atp11, mitochondrial n=1 Tax=Ceratocystis fimbriata CBS 114723 TaxID=1035309 RepID=A0A2C5WVE1_9PEZI|nr:Protein atp11, mitochondrial [Ceratocystis fimbriata CBS 114723]
MSSRYLALRRLVSTQARIAPFTAQRRWAAVHDVRWLVTTQESRTVLETYREKLARRAKEEGLESIDQLRAAYADKIAKVRKADSTLPPGALISEDDSIIKAHSETESSSAPAADATDKSDTSATAKASCSPADATVSSTPNRAAAEAITKKAATGKSNSGIKTLGEILDLDKVRDLPSRELTAIWRLRYASNPDSLCAVIPTSTYNAMAAVAKRAPQFVLPVPHPDKGAEIHFLQWTFDAASCTSSVLFTQLAEYKMRGEFSQPHTTITHHLDLADKRGLVLMQGQVVNNRGAKVQDAQFLIMCMQKFYGAWEGIEAGKVGEERRNLIDYFVAGDERFSVERLMEETERLV